MRVLQYNFIGMLIGAIVVVFMLSKLSEITFLLFVLSTFSLSNLLSQLTHISLARSVLVIVIDFNECI